MLPSLGFNEIIILGILALIVVGPKDLPLLFRKLGRWTAKLRGMAQEFRTGFDELARQAELDELKREVDALRRTTSLQEIGRDLTKPLPTLEDYAGVSKPAAIQPAPPSPLAGGGREGGAGGALSGEDTAVTPTPSPAPQGGGETAEPAADVEVERAADEELAREQALPEHADAAPIARSAP